MKILLDTNVWSYVADEGFGDDLLRVALDVGVDVAVAPAVVDEVKAIPDAPARKRALLLITDHRWFRLLPEAFSEAQELKFEIERLRPPWMIKDPKLDEVNRLLNDWVAISGGYWDRARADIQAMPTDESERGNDEQRLAREDAYKFRKNRSKGSQKGGNSHLRSVATFPPPGTPGWDGDPIAYWRVPSLLVFRNELAVYTSPYREWLDSEIDIQEMFRDEVSLNRLWLYDLRFQAMQRQWIRGAFEFLQMWFKVTDGTPGDARMSTHLVEVDHFVSADKNMVRIGKRCRDQAPFALADSHLIPSGRPGVEKLIKTIRGLVQNQPKK